MEQRQEGLGAQRLGRRPSEFGRDAKALGRGEQAAARQIPDLQRAAVVGSISQGRLADEIAVPAKALFRQIDDAEFLRQRPVRIAPDVFGEVFFADGRLTVPGAARGILLEEILAHEPALQKVLARVSVQRCRAHGEPTFVKIVHRRGDAFVKVAEGAEQVEDIEMKADFMAAVSHGAQYGPGLGRIEEGFVERMAGHYQEKPRHAFFAEQPRDLQGPPDLTVKIEFDEAEGLRGRGLRGGAADLYAVREGVDWQQGDAGGPKRAQKIAELAQGIAIGPLATCEAAHGAVAYGATP